MTGMNLPETPPEIYNKNKDTSLPLHSNKETKKKKIKKQKFGINDDDEEDLKVNIGDEELKECNLIVFQSSFTTRSSINFSLLRPVLNVLKERKLDSNHVNGFIAIVGNESLQFIDPITSSKSILSVNLPQDVDSCAMIVDFIRFKHPAINSPITTPHSSDDETEDELLTSKLRNASKKLSILRVGGSQHSSDNQRSLTGRLDIYNISQNSWIMAGDLSPPRENMACVMFYGRVCVTGGNVSSSSFEPTSLCEEFSFSERKFKRLKDMNLARFGHCICSFDEKPTKLFIYGGEIKNGDWTSSVEIYDPQKRGWFMKQSSRFNRYGSSCCVWNVDDVSYIIVVSGQDENDESSKHCELYNIGENKWITLKDLNYEHGIFQRYGGF